MYDHISVDFDGTLFVDNKIDQYLVDKLNEQYNGKVFIFTSRSWGDYGLIKNLIIAAGLKYEGIVCGKLIAGKYLDDRNISIDEFKGIKKEDNKNNKSCFVCINESFCKCYNRSPDLNFECFDRCNDSLLCNYCKNFKIHNTEFGKLPFCNIKGHNFKNCEKFERNGK